MKKKSIKKDKYKKKEKYKKKKSIKKKTSIKKVKKRLDGYIISNKDDNLNLKIECSCGKIIPIVIYKSVNQSYSPIYENLKNKYKNPNQNNCDKIKILTDKKTYTRLSIG